MRSSTDCKMCVADIYITASQTVKANPYVICDYGGNDGKTSMPLMTQTIRKFHHYNLSSLAPLFFLL